MSAGMSVVGTGDFNGDNRDEILVRQTDGRVTMWTVDGGAISSQIDVVNPGLAWQVAAVGDYNGDRKADILLQHADGSVAQWLMNGAAIASAAVVASPGADWQVV
jgi:hypothetical protein